MVDTGTTYTAVVGKWTVPSVQLSISPKYAATWIGIDGALNTRLIQTGTNEDTGSDRTTYSAWIAFCPSCSEEEIDAIVEPGDQMLAEIVKNATDTWEIYIADETRSWYFETSFDYTGPGTSAEWITERPGVTGKLSTLADFGSMRWHDLRIAGADLTATSISPSYMIDTTTEIIAYPGALGSATTDNFTDYYGTPLPTVTSVSPSEGSTSGGMSVTITGTYFVTGLVESVHFGTQLASFTVDTEHTIKATAPPESAGTVNVRVTTTDGTSAVSSADEFTYVAPTTTTLTSTPNPSTYAQPVTLTTMPRPLLKFGGGHSSFRLLPDRTGGLYQPLG